jgi:hypothetical protein
VLATDVVGLSFRQDFYLGSKVPLPQEYDILQIGFAKSHSSEDIGLSTRVIRMFSSCGDEDGALQLDWLLNFIALPS